MKQTGVFFKIGKILDMFNSTLSTTLQLEALWLKQLVPSFTQE